MLQPWRRVCPGYRDDSLDDYPTRLKSFTGLKIQTYNPGLRTRVCRFSHHIFLLCAVYFFFLKGFPLKRLCQNYLQVCIISNIARKECVYQNGLIPEGSLQNYLMTLVRAPTLTLETPRDDGVFRRTVKNSSTSHSCSSKKQPNEQFDDASRITEAGILEGFGTF